MQRLPSRFNTTIVLPLRALNLKRIALTVALCMTLACGSGGGGEGGSSSENTPEFMRIIHAAPKTKSISVSVGGTEYVSNLSYGEGSVYFDAPEGKTQIRVKPENKALPVIDAEIELEAGKRVTYVVVEEAGVAAGALLTDDETDPDPHQFRLRIINGAERFATADVYITEVSGKQGGLASETPAVNDLAFKEAADYLSLEEGTYRVRVTLGDSTVALLDTRDLKGRDGEIKTYVILEDKGGGSPYRAAILNDNT